MPELPAAIRRQIAGVVACTALMAMAGALGLIALAAFAVALHLYLAPRLGAEVSALIGGGVFLAAALLVAALAYAQVRRWPRPMAAARPTPETPQAREPTADLAHHVAALVQEALPRHAVPATLIALLGGIAVGLNPRAAQNLIATLTSPPGDPAAAETGADPREAAPGAPAE